MFTPELLSPAGSLKNMRYAFAYGADAVYAGQPRYSLRVRNNEFNHENLAKGIQEAHKLGKKFYVVVNIAPHNAKLKTFIRDLEPVIAMGPDALIMSDPGLIMMVREHFPQLQIVARARNVTHYYRLQQLGVELIERETLDAALMSGRSVFELMGWERHAARNQALRFRRHSIELMQRMAPHSGDEKKLIALAKQGREQLEAQWAAERAEQAQARGDWQRPTE